jgi:glycine/D-amino acid oxidase-like deaminating enzyme
MIDSPAYTAAVCQAATALGAELRLGPLAGIVRRGTRVTAVRAKSDTILCDALILATGPYLEDAENWLSTAIPVRPLKGQLLKAAIPPPAFRHHVTWKAAGIYSLPGGAAWLGGTQENAGYDRQPTAEGREAVLDAVSRLVPSLRNEARIISHEAALRPMTPDGLPVLGRVPDWENVYVVSGAGTKGMLLGAGMGECAACIVTDSQPACDVQPFSLDRFNPQPCPVLEASPQS